MRSFPRSATPGMRSHISNHGVGVGVVRLPSRSASVTTLRRRCPSTPQPRRCVQLSRTGASKSPGRARRYQHGENLPPHVMRAGRRSPHRCRAVGGGSAPLSRRPPWDFTSSDMTRYQLSPVEQLRRHLLRISKHHDEASSQVQQKLSRMQENIAPFLPTPEPRCHGTPSTSTKASRKMPCFASRVPTGRLPVREDSDCKASRNVNAACRAFFATQFEFAEDLPDDIGSPENMLETEIGDFLTNDTCDSTGLVKKYRVLRRTSNGCGLGRQGAFRTAMGHHQFPARNSELSEIEDDTLRLEAHLAWWQQQHKDFPLEGQLCDAEDVSDSDEPLSIIGLGDGDELTGCSEWLRLSAVSATQRKSQPTEEVVTDSSIPEPSQQRGPNCLELGGNVCGEVYSADIVPEPSRLDAAAGAFDTHRLQATLQQLLHISPESSLSGESHNGGHANLVMQGSKENLAAAWCFPGASLSQLVAKQAAELFGVESDEDESSSDCPRAVLNATTGQRHFPASADRQKNSVHLLTSNRLSPQRPSAQYTDDSGSSTWTQMAANLADGFRVVNDRATDFAEENPVLLRSSPQPPCRTGVSRYPNPNEMQMQDLALGSEANTSWSTFD